MKTVLITGGARGIGLEIAKCFLENPDYFVIVSDINTTSLELIKKQFKHSSRFGTIHLDVSNEIQVKSVINKVNKIYNQVDILVNNAAISPKHNGEALKIDNLTLEEWNKVLSINLTGAFLCTREVLKSMKRKKWGRIINITSQAARTGATISGVHYASSKSGIVGLSRTIAKQFGEYNITSNCLSPGRIFSEMSQGVSNEVNDKFIEAIPSKRMGTGKEVGDAVLFLASENAAYINGTVVDINGGSFIG